MKAESKAQKDLGELPANIRAWQDYRRVLQEQTDADAEYNRRKDAYDAALAHLQEKFRPLNREELERMIFQKLECLW